ncbi:UNVERIFIED_CONTAM: hypothetical protein K2H54_041330 [Gekko kuhli]
MMTTFQQPILKVMDNWLWQAPNVLDSRNHNIVFDPGCHQRPEYAADEQMGVGVLGSLLPEILGTICTMLSLEKKSL